MSRIRLADAVAVVTGAAHGIGRAVAIELAGRGCRLALVDRDAAALDASAEVVRTRAGDAAAPVTVHTLDVTSADAPARLLRDVLDAHGSVRLLVNNAGAALMGRADEISDEELRWLFEVNFFAPVALAHAFLPSLRRSAPARVVNVSSIFGIVAPTEHSAYVASKFALRGYSESLRHELEGSGVGVTVVHPGGVRTDIARRARVAAALDPADAAEAAERFTRLALRMPPERAARRIADAIERGRPRVLIGADARAAELVQRLMPGRYWSVLRHRFERFGRRS